MVLLTAKGTADYVAKYVSKYGAGQSVAARIGSIIDEIITRMPEKKTMTVTQLMAKALITTAVPDTLRALEAWHLLWDLDRVMCSRNFVSLPLDEDNTLRALYHVDTPNHAYLIRSFQYWHAECEFVHSSANFNAKK